MTVNQQQNQQTALAAQKKLRLDDFIKNSLHTVEGREYFYWLLEICHIGKNPFTSNALNTSFLCGELNIGQQIQAHIIEVSPANFLKMLVEKEELNGTNTNFTTDYDNYTST